MWQAGNGTRKSHIPILVSGLHEYKREKKIVGRQSKRMRQEKVNITE